MTTVESLSGATTLLPAQLGHVIAGEIRTGGPTHPVLNPATGEQIAAIPFGDRSDVDAAVAAASAALRAWRARTPGERAKVLLDMADIVDANAEELARLESLNTGKPLAVSRGDIPGVSDALRFMAGAVRAQSAPAPGQYVTGQFSVLVREPVGVIGAITPWNYPLLTASWKFAPSLAVGNTMVLKPSELTPLTTLAFAELVRDILPPGVLNIVLGDGPVVGNALSTHPDIAMVTLTGSVGSGKAVATAAAGSLKRVHLELGGKAPVIVFDDADLGRVAEGVRFAGYWNTGQECGAATRILCAESIRDDLLAALVPAVESIKVGDPAVGEDIEMGPLVSGQQQQRVAAHVVAALEAGATAATGGRLDRDAAGFFYPPTVLADITPDMAITRDEVFGPVVTVETFSDEADAIAAANKVEYGLAASVWTANGARAQRVSSALDFGTVWINSHLAMASEMPWGGFGASGFGREMSILALEEFSRTKHVMTAFGETS